MAPGTTSHRPDYAVKKAFKEQWPLLPELDEEMESKREALEQMRLRDEELGSRLKGDILRPRAVYTCRLRDRGDLPGQ